MGFSKPKAVKQDAAPPPVTTNSADVAQAQMDEQRAQERRNGYQDTINPQPIRRTLLSRPNTVSPAQPQRRTLISTR